MRKIIYTLIGIFLLLGCNKPIEEPIEENYEELFGRPTIPLPSYEDAITMPKLSCIPNITNEKYVYPGKEVRNKRKYKVTLCFWFKEEHSSKNQSITNVQADINLVYINANKELVKLTSLKEKDLKNDTPIKISFDALSGFPLFLGITGGYFDYFDIKTSIQAISEDGLIVTPIIEYSESTYADGASDTELNFCEKIILP